MVILYREHALLLQYAKEQVGAGQESLGTWQTALHDRQSKRQGKQS